MTATIEIQRDGEDFEVEVAGRIRRGCRGSRDRYGVPEEQDEAPEMELVDVGPINGKPTVLDADEEERAIEALWTAQAERECFA